MFAPGIAKTTAPPATLEGMQGYLQGLQAQVNSLENRVPEDRVTLVVTSNDFDRIMPAYIIATGAASSGMDVTMFFSLWGLLALRTERIMRDKTFLERMMAYMTPKSAKQSGLSKMNMMGMGSAMFKHLMRKHNVATITELMDTADALGVETIACQMTMGLMGVTREEMRPGLTYGGVAAFIESASRSKVTLFI